MFYEYGSDKDSWHSYGDFYKKLLKEFPSNLKLLEIGVYEGSSMMAWRAALPNAELTGIDVIYPRYQNGYEFFLLDCNSEDIHKIFENRMFDIIIDDGSHALEDQLGALNKLFPHLKDGGVYVIEDVTPFENTEKFKEYGNVEIMDYRNQKNKAGGNTPKDDVLVVIRK